ncbi:hypothetical protein BOX15_Mlig019823g1 [Macrostomum lignano]|uniref:Serine/threonine-protein phosphatase n=1 Tax=Macrostomum lignano TaxID=282301 RepID=A0A267FJR0_9PLAT|nr:hypothetical protein BOX15_Mlig019823g1 [Macrostomum lignano]
MRELYIHRYGQSVDATLSMSRFLAKVHTPQKSRLHSLGYIEHCTNRPIAMPQAQQTKMGKAGNIGNALDPRVFEADGKTPTERVSYRNSILSMPSQEEIDRVSLFDDCSQPMSMIDIDLTDVEHQILHSEFDQQGNLKASFVTEQLCYTVAKLSRDHFRREPALLEIGRPTFIVGDLHGQFRDLLRILDALGYPPTDSVLFLGDYVDRGQCSLEVIVTLLLMKIRYPDRVYILRGNHEVAKVNKRYGFKNECLNRFNHLNVYTIFNRVFDYLPVAALIDSQFFCCHGGISEVLLRQQPGVENLKRVVNAIRRPFSSLSHRDLETDLLWSDPMEDTPEMVEKPTKDQPKQKSAQGQQQKKTSRGKPVFSASSRGIGYKFNSDATDQFVRRNSLKAVIRAHQVMKMGLSVQHNMQCITVFSAPGYFNNKNYGAVAYLMKMDNSELVESIRVLQFSPNSCGGGGMKGQ